MNWRTTLILAFVVLGVFAYLRFFEMKQPSTGEARRQAQNVVNFDRNKIDGVVIQNGDEKVEIRRHDNKWRLETPFKDQADGALVENLLSDLESWQKEGIIPAKDIDADKSKLNEYGLNRPKLKLKLIGSDRPPEILFGKDAALEGRMYIRFENSKETFLAKQSVKKDIDKKEDKGQMLQIGSVPEKEKDQVYVRFAPRGAVYTLPRKIEEVLNIKPADLRDYHLVRIDTNVLDRITIDVPGKGKTVLARKDGNWTIASRNNAPADSGAVRRLIDTLQNQRVTKFVEDVASNLPKYGLDKPHLQLTFSSFASENTAETKAGEQPFATLAFGKEDGDNVYARLTDEPFVVAVRRGLLDQISAEPLQWQALSIFKFKPDEIHRLSITTDKELSLERGENNQWHWLKGSGEVDRTNVQSLLNTLSTLHAVRWLGATKPQDGFEKPQLTLAFTTSRDNKASHKLIIGAPASDGTW